jgi:hypothetical protein
MEGGIIVSSKNRRFTLVGFCAHNLVGVLCVLILRVPGNATFRCNVFFVPTRAYGAYALKRECTLKKIQSADGSYASKVGALASPFETGEILL